MINHADMADKVDHDDEQQQLAQTSAPGNVKIRTKPIQTAELPRKTLEECLKIARPIHETYAGKNASIDEIASAIGSSPKTSATKYLLWGALAYDLIIKDGESFSLTETGRKILAPTYPDEVLEAKVKAITIPTILSRFYNDYNGKILPDDDYFANVLETKYNIPRERTAEAKKIIIGNAEYADIINIHANGKKTIRLDIPKDGAASQQGGVSPTNADSIAVSRPTPSHVKTESGDICFYITPIGEEGSIIRRHSDMMLKHLVEPAFRQFNIKVVRADKIEKSGLISQQIFNYIVRSQYCVADLSFGNPNAFYELAIRHITKLPTIQIIQKSDKIPFDVSQGRTITVDVTDVYALMDRMESAKRELVEHIKNFIEPSGKDHSDGNPVLAYLPGLEVKLPTFE